MSGSPPCGSEDYLHLVKCAKQGDTLAYEMLWQAYGPGLCTFLLSRVGNEEDARELAQEAFLKAWTNLSSLRDENAFKTWLYSIAINEIKAFLRRAGPRHWLPWEKGEWLARVEQSSREVETQVAERDLIQRALKYVSPQYRACLLLQIVAGFRQREIAELLHMPVGNVSTNVKRGMAQLTQAYFALEHEHEIDTCKSEQRRLAE